MPIDTQTPNSPGWWLEYLSNKLLGQDERIRRAGCASRQSWLQLLDDYFTGNPPLPEGAENSREAYRNFQRKARLNLAELVVEAPRQRMIPVGFRTGAAGDENGDREARRIWSLNDLDVESSEVHRMMLAMGDGYVLVGRDEDGQPLITAEDPRQVITEHDPRQQRKVVAALKLFTDEVQGVDFAYLYLPGRVRVAYRQVGQVRTLGMSWFRAQDWEWAPELSGDFPVPVVPVVRFRNKRGIGEYEPHLDHLDRINHMLLQRMVIATMQAFRQRAIRGNLPERDSAGNLIDYNALFVADPGAMWQVPEGVDIWESQQADLTPNLSSVRDDIRDLAAATFTPLHYLNPDAANQSAEGATLAREGLVFRAEDRIARATIGWRQVMSLAFRFAGDEERANLSALEPIWAPVERMSLSERADAAVKAGTDYPWRTKMTDIWQVPPEQVDRMETERAGDALLAGALAPEPVEQPVPEA